MRSKNRLFYCLLHFIICHITIAQTIDFGSFTGNPFKIGGGVAFNSTYFNSNRSYRDPFVYNFTGNLNLSFYSFSMPISYSFTNMGGKLSYQVPFNFNRLSLNPRYKWISVYIGDTVLNFSPYSLSGHQFTGGGVELTPEGPIKFTALYGRFLKAVEEDQNPNTIPSYERWGYGSKVEYNLSRYKFGLIGFYAKDLENSLHMPILSKNITPKENFVIGLNFEGQLLPDFKLYLDYSNSSLVQDTRALGVGQKKGLAAIFIKGNTSTQNFNAFKLGFDYKIDKTILGISYERIDPNYLTLGAYFFANDLQNIMLNMARPLFHDKVTLSLNTGIQRDNLDNKKAQTTQRLVGTLNANIKFSDRFNSSFTFSNQSTVSNVNPDQFVRINQLNPELNQLDQLNYRQLSRNANLMLNYAFAENKKTKRNTSLNYSFNQVANEQGGKIQPGQQTAFHNINALYSHFFIQSKWSFNTSLNYTYNDLGIASSYTLGPVLSVSKKWCKDKLATQLGTAFNTTKADYASTQNFNFRLNANYKLFEEHHFNMMLSQVFVNSNNTKQVTSNSFHDFTLTFGYNYNFAGTKKKQKEEDQKRIPIASLEKEKIKIQVKDTTLEADSKSIRLQVDSWTQKSNFVGLPELEKKWLSQKENLIKKTTLFDSLTNQKLKIQLGKQIQQEVASLEKEFIQLETFTDQYDKIVKSSKEKIILDLQKNNLEFNSQYLVSRYHLNSNLLDKTEKDLHLFEEDIIAKKVKLSKKDYFILSQINLRNMLESSRFEDL
ncbi:hypothetical protein, partial [Flavobacterium oreochromis]